MSAFRAEEAFTPAKSIMTAHASESMLSMNHRDPSKYQI